MSATVVTIDYKPFRSQARFHASTGDIRLAAGGVGSGKTHAGAVEAVALALENPGCDGFIVAPTWGTLKRVTLRKFLEFLPQEVIADWNKGERYILLKNGGRVYYGSADNPSSLEGSTIAWFWGDEARYWKREAYDILLARMREPKSKRIAGILTSTPALGWLYDEFCTGREGRSLIKMPTEDNKALPPGYIEHLKRSYSKTLFRQYVMGDFVALEGAVYGDSFDMDIHMRTIQFNPHIPVDLMWDFGYRSPALLFSQRLSDDHVHVFAEEHPERISTKDLELAISRRFKRNKWIRGTIYCDPAGKAHEQTTGESSIEELEKLRWRVDQPDPKDKITRTIAFGVDMVRERLSPLTGPPSLTFCNSLRSDDKRGIFQAVQMYSYQAIKDGRPIIDEPKKDGITDHACDALRYGVLGYWPPQHSTIRAW